MPNSIISNHYKLKPYYFRVSFIIVFTILLFLRAYSQRGLKAEYYDGTNFERLETVRYVPNIDLSWNATPPVPGINPHECSIRWTGNLMTSKSGTYSFSAQVDDGIRVWIDNKMIINQWELNDMGVFEGKIHLESNQKYKLKVEYFNALLEGEVRLLWMMHKEELSWYERMFGEEKNFTVIAPEYFLPIPEPIKTSQDIAVKTNKKVSKKSTKKKAILTQNKKKTIIKKKENNTVSPQVKEVIKPAPPKPIVSAKEVEKYIPKNVQFIKGKTIVLESSYPELNSFVQFMLKYPHLKVEVEGHTDVVGDKALNLQLSKDRATTITNYLIDKGIDKLRIKSNGYGSTRPLFVPANGKSYPANRRVMFIVDGM